MTTHMTLAEYDAYLQSGEAPNAMRHRRQQRERDELVHPLMEAFQRCDWVVHHEEDSRLNTRSDNGFPDIVAVKGWHRIEVECKLDGESPTAGQARWLDQLSCLTLSSYHWVCVWHLSQYDAALGYIQHPGKVTPPGVWKGK